MNCKNCGLITPIYGGKHKKYCNTFCIREWERKTEKKIFSEINCGYCNKLFLPVSKQNKYCCAYCKCKIGIEKRSKKPKTKECKHCKKEFRPYNSLDKFCSANCRTNHHKSKRSRNWTSEQIEKRKGVGNPCFRHGMYSDGKQINIRDREFRRNGNALKSKMKDEYGFLFCENCKQSNLRFETHHIVFRSEKPDHEHIHNPLNLIHLCVPCHNEFHKHKGKRNELVEKRNLAAIFGNDILDK